MYCIEIKKSAQKELLQISSLYTKKIIKAINNFAINKRPNDCKKLNENKAYNVICSLLLCILFSFVVEIAASQTLPDAYNVVWTSQSKNASESMPCGGGDIGLNVWAENGDILMYVSRSGTFDENNTFPKLGRLRLHITPNLFDKNYLFKQELRLQDGSVQLTGSNQKQKAVITIWVDVFHPVIHVDVKCTLPVEGTVSYESWRAKDRVLSTAEQNETSYKTMQNITVTSYKDSVGFRNNNVLFYHRNRNDASIFDYTVHEQGLNSIKEQLWNPLHNLTFGGLLQGSHMVPAGTDTGIYANTSFTAWKLKTDRATEDIRITMFLHTDTTQTIADWQNHLFHLVQETNASIKTEQQKSKQWWQQFWNRSYIYINADKPDTSSHEWQVGRNYQLFRYMLGCNAYGSYPTKFNGGLFTYDPIFTRQDLPFSPDFRLWGGGTFTAQNQRLVYWPMLKSGDIDMMKPQFDFYLRILHNAELIVKTYWHHKGALFNEQIENFGLPQAFEYNSKRPAYFDKGLLYNNWIDYTWDTILEFCLMILQTQQYENKDIHEYMPLIKSSLIFFDEHYQREQSKRSANALDENGHLVLYPGSAAETYKITYNSITTIAGLSAVLKQLLQLPAAYIDTAERANWLQMLSRIPPFTFRQMQSHTTLSPAITWERINNEEIPQLYPVFPYGEYGIGKPCLDTVINTWKYDTEAAKYKGFVGWKQDNIWCARLGLTEEAADLTKKKLQNSGRRFPAFWGPGFDWAPDHNWGGSGMIGLEEMLMQTNDKAIYLLPAWPKNWNGYFKLHAPYNTVVKGSIVNGTIRNLEVIPAERKKDVIIMDSGKKKAGSL